MIISDPNLVQSNNIPAYLSQKNVQLAKNVRKKISEDLSCHLTLQQLSEEFHASPTSIKTAFKSVYGETIGEYLKSFRLQEAQRLLQDTDWHILEIAELVGYSNPGHFAVAFREKYKMTPSEYRKSIRSKGK
ncbi:MAG: helix-turn-helix transcriptional regulator [Solobacterium sp.]|nr:helix-turn-helix transcriptional regulator [Solobacterium sp.]